MKIKRSFILTGLVALFIFIQLIPVNRENPVKNSELELIAPPEIKTILMKSCYDCHSNQTNWPFYSYIAPVSWLISRDVEKGRKHLNFSEWSNLPVEKMIKAKEEIVEEISEDEMPLSIYVLMHSDAELDNEQKKKLKDWVGQTTD